MRYIVVERLEYENTYYVYDDSDEDECYEEESRVYLIIDVQNEEIEDYEYNYDVARHKADELNKENNGKFQNKDID